MFKTGLFIGVTLATQLMISAAQARSHRHVLDANGNAAVAVVKSRSGVTARGGILGQRKTAMCRRLCREPGRPRSFYAGHR
jgi:hypothetical protein